MLRFKVGEQAIYAFARYKNPNAPCRMYEGKVVTIIAVGPFAPGHVKKVEYTEDGMIITRSTLAADYDIEAEDGHQMSCMDWQLIKLGEQPEEEESINEENLNVEV